MAIRTGHVEKVTSAENIQNMQLMKSVNAGICVSPLKGAKFVWKTKLKWCRKCVVTPTQISLPEWVLEKQ